MSHPQAGAEFMAQADFLGREGFREIDTADFGVADGGALEIMVSQITAAQIGITQITAAEDDFIQVHIPEVGSSKVTAGQINLIAFGDNGVEHLVIAHTQRFKGFIVHKLRFAVRHSTLWLSLYTQLKTSTITVHISLFLYRHLRIKA